VSSREIIEVREGLELGETGYTIVGMEESVCIEMSDADGVFR